MLQNLRPTARRQPSSTLGGMILYVPLLMGIVGVLMYALSSNQKLVEIGRLLFAAAAFAYAFALAGHVTRVLGP